MSEKLSQKEFTEVTEVFHGRLRDEMESAGCNDLYEDEFSKSICDKFSSDTELFDAWEEMLFNQINFKPMAQQSPMPKETKIEVKPNMDFPDALREVIAGKKIARMEWEDKSVYGFLNADLLSLHKADGKNYKWIINDGDLLSDDYIVV